MSSSKIAEMYSKSQIKVLETSVKILQLNPDAAVEEILLASDVSRGTFYKYFKSKQDLLIESTMYCMYMIDDLLTEPFLDQRNSAIQKIEIMFREIIPMGEYFSFLMHFQFLHTNEVVAKKYRQHIDILNLTIKEAQEEGAIREDLPLEWISEYLDSLLYAGWSSLQKGKLSKEKIIEYAIVSFRSCLNPSQNDK